MNRLYYFKKSLTVISLLIWLCLFAVHTAMSSAAGFKYFRALIMAAMTVVSIIRIKI